VSAADGLCLVIDESDGQQGAEGCGGGVRGEPVTSYPKDQAPDRWVGFLSGGLSDTTERLVVGPVAAGVSAVDVRLASGADIAATMVPAPKELGLRLGFYTVTHPATDELTAIVALASDGKVLQELRLPPGFR